MAHPTLHHFININFWEKERNAAVLRRHWDMWFPRRTRLELGTVISSLVTTQLQIFCGMKNGRIAVYDQNLWPAAVLDKHKKEVVAMAVSEDLLVSVSKDQDLVTWSTRSKVCLSRLQLAAPAHSVSLVCPHILVGLDTG